ncbi:MAG: D-2-hydroxyacid dehydrogenase [Sedimentisphaeraceae bacterium JB056]
MKIVVTDGVTLNPGDLDWELLSRIGECEIYDNSTRQECIERCKDADIVVNNKVVFDKDMFEALPDLKMISVTATGYDVVDIKEAASRGVVVTNVPEYGTLSVAQMVFSLLLELSQHVGYHSCSVYAGKWAECDSFCYWDKPLIELNGLTLGLIGCGRIGRNVAIIAKAFGMKVIGYDPGAAESDLIELVDMDFLLSRSDVVSLHCPLTENTRELIDKNCLEKMKKTSFLINTSRGSLVNEADLANALNDGLIAGAGLDVLSTEPPSRDNPLFSADNCYITPHIAWATHSARARLMSVAISNIEAFVAGKPVNVVS